MEEARNKALRSIRKYHSLKKLLNTGNYDQLHVLVSKIKKARRIAIMDIRKYRLLKLSNQSFLPYILISQMD